MHFHFTSIDEPIADFKWQKFFRARWPAYKVWLAASGHGHNPEIALAALNKYMPEMVPTHEHLCRLVGADDLAFSFLTGFQPPTYSGACSQAVTASGTVQLVRNYDFHLDRFEGTQLKTAWHEKKVIAVSDCLIGVLDGMNEDGLAISLAFGGRTIVGYGFGIPFILRYILEFCSCVDEAVEVLHRIPSHMAYNVTITDKSGVVKTVLLAPDRTTVVTNASYATNHQGTEMWTEIPLYSNTRERAIYLDDLLSKGFSGEALIHAFLKPPLYNHGFSTGFGTLYTSAYLPTEGLVKMYWPSAKVIQSFDKFTEVNKLITLI